jgi:hypothetical protein
LDVKLMNAVDLEPQICKMLAVLCGVMAGGSFDAQAADSQVV